MTLFHWLLAICKGFLTNSSGLALAVLLASHKVLVEVDVNISLIVGNLQRILEQQLRPHPGCCSCWPWSLDGSWWHCFTDCWQFARDFRPTAQASPNPLINDIQLNNFRLLNKIKNWSPSCPNMETEVWLWDWVNQGSLTEGEGPVQLTSLHKPV